MVPKGQVMEDLEPMQPSSHLLQWIYEKECQLNQAPQPWPLWVGSKWRFLLACAVWQNSHSSPAYSLDFVVDLHSDWLTDESCRKRNIWTQVKIKR